MREKNQSLKVRKGRYNGWEKSIIRKLYPTGGPRAVRVRFERLGYTRRDGNIQATAYRIGVRFGELEGYVRLSEMCGATAEGRSWLKRLAKADGVLVRCGFAEEPRTGDVYLVPEDWADDAAERIGEAMRVSDDREWMGTEEAADLLGVEAGTVTHGLRGANRATLLKSCLDRVPRGKDVRGCWRLRRYELRLAAREYRARKALPKERFADGKWISRAA